MNLCKLRTHQHPYRLFPTLHLVEIYKSASGEQIRAEASPARQCTAVCHTDTDTGKSVTQTQTLASLSHRHRHWQVCHTDTDRIHWQVCHTDTDSRHWQVQSSSCHTQEAAVKREAIHNMYLLLLLIALPVPSSGPTLHHFFTPQLRFESTRVLILTFPKMCQISLVMGSSRLRRDLTGRRRLNWRICQTETLL